MVEKKGELSAALLVAKKGVATAVKKVSSKVVMSVAE